MYSQIDKATDYLRALLRIVPDVVIVLNSSLSNLAKEMPELKKPIPFSSIPGFVSSNTDGRTSTLYFGVVENKNALLIANKPYYYEGISCEDLAFPYRVFANLGIKNIVFATSSGAINETYNIGDVVLFKDHISLFAPNLLIGKNYTRFGPRLIDMTNTYDNSLREKIMSELNKENNIRVKEGIYAYSTGPSYETPSDVKALKILGADMVGMCTVPEATLCHQMGMNIVALSLITNKASGLNDKPLSYREVVLNGRISEAKQKSIVKEIVRLIPKD